MRLLFNTITCGRALTMLFIFLFSSANANVFANDNFPKNKTLTDEFGNEYLVNFTCDNLTDGGQIEGDEMGFPNPIFNPAPITNVVLPSGGTGDIEYLWIRTFNDPSQSNSQWNPINNSNSMDYDPSPMDITTWYRRCARRSGCTQFIAESNIVRKTVLTCDNVTAGGSIGANQNGCAPFDPTTLANVVAPTGGTGDLEYLWFQSNVNSPFSSTSGDWVAISNSNTENFDPEALTQTTYFIRTSRRFDCTEYLGESNVVEITVLASPILTAEITSEIACFSEQMGAIDLTISGSDAPFQINWDNGIGAIEDPQNLAAGTYSVTVTNAISCSAETTVIITQPEELMLNLIATGTDCQGGTTGSATAMVSGGTPDFTYLWNDPNMQTSATATNLNVGDYSVTVTDANGCSATENVTIGMGTNMMLSIESQNEICHDENNGMATVNVTNGTSPFSFQWNDTNMQTTQTASNLSPGDYEVTVSDAAGCQETEIVTIGEGELVEPILGATAPTCFNGNDGTAFVDDIVGGIPDFTYQWNDPNSQTTETATGLEPGIYSVTVTDANGCTAVENIEIENLDPIIVEVIGTNESCLNLSNGSAMVNLVSNALAPFTYLWSENGQTTSAIDNLNPGFYEVTITDANGCSGVENIEILDGTGIEISVFGTNETCENAGDGSATVTSVNNGTPPFSYQWDDANNQTTDTANGLSSGTFQVIVTDATGCTGTAGVILTAGTALEVAISKTDVQCGGDADGTATVTVSDGSAPFSFQWNDPNNQTTATATGLGMGNYQVTVTDNNGCSSIENVSIIAPMSFAFDLQKTDNVCPNGTNGTAEVIISNGNINDFSFQWNDTNNSTTAVILELSTGNYEVTITDINGCMDIGMVTINGPADFDNIVMTTGASCSDANDGSATVNPVGGTPPYTFLWSDPNGTTANVLSNVIGGGYVVTITDNVGCTVEENVFIFAPSPLNINLEAVAENCAGNMDGSVTANVSGGTEGYTFQWDDPNNSTTATINGLPNGTYSVTVTDANGCTIAGNTNVSINSSLTINVTTSDLTCTDQTDGSATVTITGGQPDFNIQWNDDNNSTTGMISNLDVGFYGVTVTDATGCTASAMADIFELAPIEISIAKEDVICSDDINGSATATVTGGTGIYFYQWFDIAEQTTQTADNLPVGTYQVDVTDTNGCIGSATVEIEFTSNLTATANTENASCFGGNDGGVTALPTGGVAPYDVAWASIGNGLSVDNLTAGTYTATVTDAVGCTTTLTATVSQPDQFFCEAAVAAPIVNFGSNNGALTVSPTGGTGNFTYEWNNGELTQTTTNLAAGTYTVTVVDENSCTCSSTITLNNPCKIGDLVWEDDNENGVFENDENGVSGVSVTLTGTAANGASVNQSVVTDNLGNYAFDNLAEGQYQLQFTLPNNHVFTAQNIGNEAIDSDANPNTGITETFQLNIGEFNTNIDAGIYLLDDKINIGNFVFFDSNRDGIQDVGEIGIGGITVRLFSALTNAMVAVESTNFSGYYSFAEVTPGAYYIEFDLNSLPDSYVFTEQNSGVDETLDSDADTLTGQTDVFELFIFDADDYSFDAGVYAKCDNVTQGGEISGNEQLCGIGADPGIISNAIAPSGGFGTLEYLWLQSSIPVYNGQGDPNWQPVPNSNTAFLNPGPITQTTYYIRCARRECCEAYPEESNIIIKEVKQVPLANIEQAQNVACIGEEVDYAATNAGFGSVYSWNFAADATPATAATRLVPNVTWSSEGVKTVALTVTKDGCSLTVTRNISIVTCNAPNALVGFNDFYLENIDNQVMLHWEMTENISTGLFYIQHSHDNDYFETIGMVENIDQELSYYFMDENPRRGENFYRIRYSPLVGERMDSETQMSLLALDDLRTVNFYPNPFNSQATIELLERQDVPVVIQLTNNYGQVIQTLEIPAGENNAILTVANLPNGMYFLQILQEGRRPRVERIFKADR